jgi:4-amino-4-deoxy-L-arabinose transferase-like glycosyltransferase
LDKRDYIKLALLFTLATVAAFLVRQHVFFWDTVQLGAKHAYWYYEHNFRYFLLPDEIDSGHPPVFGIYLAGVWSLFGKTLPVSHLAMLPFIYGIVYALYRLGKYYIGPQWALPMSLFVLLDPVLAGQLTLVSPDLVLISGFLLAWWSVLTGNRLLQIFCAILMAMISTRGMMVVLALYIFESLQGQKWEWKYWLGNALPYVPAGLLSLAFLAYHYYEKGWIGYHADSPWAPGFQRVGPAGVFYNFLILGFRYLDFGRVFVWLAGGAAIIGIWQLKKKELRKMAAVQSIGRLLLILAIFLSITFLLYQGLQSHRYLLPAFITLNILVFTLIANSTLRFRRLLLALAFVGLASGNLWIYPDKMSQDWDCTLAHLPYYHLRASALQYLDANDIPLEEVGTAFPEIGPVKFRDLSDSNLGFKAKDLQRDQWILYSNVMNDFTDTELDALAEWKVEQIWKSNGIRFVLYKK